MGSKIFWNIKNKLGIYLRKIPYSVLVSLQTVAWAFLCAAFGAFFILSRADFETTGTKAIFIFIFPLYILFAAIFSILEYSKAAKNKKRREDIEVLNRNIINGHLRIGVSTKDIKKIFFSLPYLPANGIKLVFKYGGLVIFMSLLTEWLASGEIINLPVIFVSGVISVLLVALFGTFFVETYIYSIVKECKENLIKRGEKFKESRSFSLKSKFNYFLFLLLLVILSILSFVFPFNFNLALFSFFGFAIAAILTKMLFSSIYKAFLEIEEFARELPSGKKAIFSTGALDKETISLSKNLNAAANEIYASRRRIEASKKELEETKTILEIRVGARTKELKELAENLEEKVKERTKELQDRVEELESFHKFAVDRELKMIELKEKITELTKKTV